VIDYRIFKKTRTGGPSNSKRVSERFGHAIIDLAIEEAAYVSGFVAAGY